MKAVNTLQNLLKLDVVILHNPLRDWLVALAITVAIVLLAALVKRIAVRRLSRIARRTVTQIDDAVVKALQATRLWLVFIIALEIGTENLKLAVRLTHAIDHLATVAVFVQVGLWLAALFNFWLQRQRSHAMETEVAAASSLSAMGFVGRALLWVVLLLLMLDNLGVNVTTLVASLGVGGIAIGFALQNILGDLFASLSIILDKPFVIGDFITVDAYSGTVENIGIKTSRLRSIDGELLVFGNGDLIKSRLRNYKHLRERRVLFTFGVLYNTPAETLARIPQMVREAVEAQADTRFDRAHFKTFGASSLDFEVVFWTLKPDYNAYMDAQQGLNLALVRRFEQEGIGFAYPTRTLYHEGPIRVELAGSSAETPPTPARPTP